jgi:WD40 repeat protein
MVDRLTCPESARLPELLESPDPAFELLEHLSRCRRCQNALECLAVGEAGWLRSPPDTRIVGERPVHLLRVLDVLKQFPTAPDLLAVPPHDLSLEFLGPTDYPGALGAVGPYPVLEVVGRGGMGVVFRALDRALNRVIAVKVLAPQLAAHGTARKRFMREARAAAAVAHEHVVNIHAVDEANGLPYLVMEYVPGLSLQDRIDRDGPLDPQDIARIALQVAEGLAAAHAQGLVHRDVKPANILLENVVGRARLSDFGLARAVDDAGATQHGTIAGTPDYMAPEQATAQIVDHRADLYSLGCVIYAMSTGRPPFRAATALGVLHLTTTAVPLPIRAANPTVPPDLEAIALKLLAKNPAERFPSAQVVAGELRAVLVRMQQPTLHPPRRRKRVWALGACGALALVAVGAVFAPRYRAGEHSAVQNDPVEKAAPAGEQPSPGATPGAVPLFHPEGGWGNLATVPTPEVARTFDGHTSSVRGLAVHPDGKRLVSVTGWPRGDGTIRIWDTATGDSVHRILVGDVQADCVALTPSGDTIIAGFADGTVRLYEWDSETELVSLGGHDRILALAAAPVGRRIAAADATGRVRVWDPATGRVVLTVAAHAPHPCRAVAFSPDGTALATVGRDGVVRTWDAATGTKRVEASSGTGDVWGVVFADEGRTLITVSDTATVWDAATGQRLFDLRDGKPTPLTAVARAPEGTAVAACGLDGLVRVWDLRTRRLSYRASAGVGAVWAVTFTPDGGHVLTGGGGVYQPNGLYSPGARFTIRMWAIDRPKKVQPPQ